MDTHNRTARWPVFLALGLLIAFVVIFAVAFVSVSSQPRRENQPAVTLNPDTYLEQVTPLLAAADPQRGDALLTQYGCAACHRAGAVNKIAPSFTGIADRAAIRRPPLTAAAYIYESILHPTAFVEDGFRGAMPENFSDRLPERDLGDIIAYLLTPDAH